MVIWVIGKSGCGKTYFTGKLYKFLKKKKKYKIKWLDGDKFRKKFSPDLGYSLNDRRKNSKRVQQFCKKFEQKKYIVLASILSLFRDHQKKNRKIFKNYLQIYIKVHTKILKNKNTRFVYSNKKNVVGKHIKFFEPYKSDFIIKNNFDEKFEKKIKIVSKKIYEQLR